MTRDLEGRRVLVVGASSGIGEAAARIIALTGADIVVASRGGAKLATVAADIGARPVSLDVMDETVVAAFFAAKAPFDHVVISAAQAATGSIATLSLDAARDAMNSKFFGAYTLAKHARIVEGGSLTFVSGLLSVRPSAAAVLQGAINAALEAVARGLALELAPTRVNTVSPGLIATGLWDGLSAEARQEMYTAAASTLPVGRVGRSEDVAAAVLFVVRNGFATGSREVASDLATCGTALRRRERSPQRPSDRSPVHRD